MSDLLKKIDELEHEILRLTEERQFVLSTLEIAADLLTFDTPPHKHENVAQILDETACKIQSLLNFEAICFYLINEDDASFRQAYCEPSSFRQAIDEQIDQLIEDQTFAWALGRNKAVRVEASATTSPLILHSLATASRARGMFVGIPIAETDEFQSPLPLLTFVLQSCANIIESVETYQKMRRLNQQLERKLVQCDKK